jgi:hypothetical protein
LYLCGVMKKLQSATELMTSCSVGSVLLISCDTAHFVTVVLDLCPQYINTEAKELCIRKFVHCYSITPLRPYNIFGTLNPWEIFFQRIL